MARGWQSTERSPAPGSFDCHPEPKAKGLVGYGSYPSNACSEELLSTRCFTSPLSMTAVLVLEEPQEPAAGPPPPAGPAPRSPPRHRELPAGGDFSPPPRRSRPLALAMPVRRPWGRLAAAPPFSLFFEDHHVIQERLLGRRDPQALHRFRYSHGPSQGVQPDVRCVLPDYLRDLIE